MSPASTQALGPVLRWHIMAGAQSRRSQLTSWPGMKERKGKRLGSHGPFWDMLQWQVLSHRFPSKVRSPPSSATSCALSLTLDLFRDIPTTWPLVLKRSHTSLWNIHFQTPPFIVYIHVSKQNRTSYEIYNCVSCFYNQYMLWTSPHTNTYNCMLLCRPIEHVCRYFGKFLSLPWETETAENTHEHCISGSHLDIAKFRARQSQVVSPRPFLLWALVGI